MKASIVSGMTLAVGLLMSCGGAMVSERGVIISSSETGKGGRDGRESINSRRSSKYIDLFL